jgi:CRP-like cAMP-binding protein
MRQLNNERLLESYVSKFNIDSFFSIDMLPYMKLLEYSKNETVLGRGSKLDYYYFHVKGTAQICAVLENGKSLLLRFSKPLTVLGDVETFTSRMILCDVIAVTECMFIGISVGDIERYCYNDPVFLRASLIAASEKVKGLTRSAPINLLYPLKTRFLSYLITVEFNEYKAENINEIKTYKLKEIAMLLGSSYRHLNRIINELVEEKVITRSKKKITIIDHQKLRQMSAKDLYE